MASLQLVITLSNGKERKWLIDREALPPFLGITFMEREERMEEIVRALAERFKLRLKVEFQGTGIVFFDEVVLIAGSKFNDVEIDDEVMQEFEQQIMLARYAKQLEEEQYYVTDPTNNDYEENDDNHIDGAM